MSIRPSAGIALAAAALLIAGCATDDPWREFQGWADDMSNTGKWEQIERPGGNRVEAIALEHPVTFPGGKAAPAAAERRQLRDFVARSRVGGSDRVYLVAPLTAAGHHDPLTAARLESVKAALAGFGVFAVTATAESGPLPRSAQPDQITLAVERRVVITPDCQQPVPPATERPVYLIGCSDTANLGLMVADPDDLEPGRSLGPADGEAAALAIQRYRKGEITPLIEIESTSRKFTAE